MNKSDPKDRKKLPSKLTFENIKKPLIGSSIIVVVAIAGIFIGITLFEENQPKPTFYFGVGYNPYAPDPLKAGHAYDAVSIFIIQQIAEGLFAVELTNGGSRVVHNLAYDHDWSPDGLNLTCYLRPNIKFHDGSTFNATVVKWNMDRLHAIYSIYGLADYLWKFPDGEWIIDEVEVINEFTVKFVLNRPFVPIISLLSSHYAYMLRPNDTIEASVIEPISKLLCGTGPFIYDSFKENESVTLLPNAIYWNGPNTNIDKIVYRIFFPNDTLGYEALANKQISMIKRVNYNEHIEGLKSIPGIIVRKITSLASNTLDMNNHFINSTMRKAISFAFNYTNFINNIRNRSETRMKSPIPPLIQYSSDDFDVPYCNITRARQALLDVDWPGTEGLIADDNVSSGNPWETIANSYDPIATYNYSYIDGNGWQMIVLDPLQEDLKQIGVKVEAYPCSGGEFIGKLYGIWGYDRSHHLFLIGWNTDYNDPYSSLNPLYSNSSFDNTANVNDTQVQQMLEEAIIEMNDTKRENIYFALQKRLIEEIYPSLWLYFDVKYDAYVENLRGVPIPYYLTCSFKDIYFV